MANQRTRSALGDYVHITSQGYIDHGTFRPWDQKSNYDQGKIFSNFQRALENKTKNIDIIKDNNKLKKLQAEYNTRRQANYQKLKELFEESVNTEKKIFAKQFTRALLDAANLPNLDEDVLIEILKFQDNDNDEATARGISLLHEAFSSQGKIKKISPFKGANYALFSTFENRLGTLEKQIEFLEKNASEKKKNNKNFIFMIGSVKQDFEILLKLCNTIKKLGKENKIGTGEFAKEIEEYNGKLETHVRRAKTGRIEISKSLADWIDFKIQAIQNKAKISDVFRNIQAGFSELMAGLTSANADALAEDTIFELIQKSVVGTKNNISVSKGITQQAKKASEQFSLENDFFHLEITSKRALGKIDAIFTLGGEEYYASVKNYNLGIEKYYNGGKEITAAVSLVTGTPLTTTLLNAESYKQTLGTHFLNILTKKEDGFGKIEAARRLGLSSLSVFLVYLGLTGGHGEFALRNEKGVNLLIIEDKATQKAYFFSISSILEKAIENINDNFLIEANGIPLENFIIKNNKIINNTDIKNNINIRLKAILAEAHAAKIHVALKNTSIQNIITKEKN